MPAKDTSAAHVEYPEHEAHLTGAIALASLFSSCVEAFGLIHPSSPKWQKDEQLLLTRLGLQQARLLIWGSVLGVSSPPASVTNRAVPKHPSSAYPDLKEPTFFDPRDPRLDDPQVRTTIEQTLSAIVDRSSAHSREEMMEKFGLKPPRRFGSTFEQALDSSRLEFWRERYELLREVAESYAHINTRRTNSIIHSSWMIADVTKFGAFIKLIQEKVDYLIGLMGVKEQVDRAMRMDIRLFGWHIIPDRSRTAMDVSKLRLLQEICKEDYPEYIVATQQALDNISRESRENSIPASILKIETDTPNGDQAAPKKRPGIMKIFRSFGSKHKSQGPGHSRSVSGPSSTAEDPGPTRSQSDAGPTNNGEAALGRVRSKSVGAYIDPPIIDEDLQNRLQMLSTKEMQEEVTPTRAESIDSPLDSANPNMFAIKRHDQYHGIARTQTKDLAQPGGDFSSG